jgi:ABC-type branched-subunit amino acid transport system ATPase component
MADALLKIEGIHKRFGGLHALNDVGLTMHLFRLSFVDAVKRLSP